MGTYVCKQEEADRKWVVVDAAGQTLRRPSVCKWVVVDAAGQTLGRLSTHVARVLMGKHRPTYTPHADTGDFVVIVNAGKVRLTGRKAEKKFYRWHTGYPGGLKEVAAGRMLKDKPTR